MNIKKMFTAALIFCCASGWMYGQNFDTEKITEMLRQQKVRNFTEVMDIDVARLAPHDQKGKQIVLVGIYLGAKDVTGNIQEKYRPDRFRVLTVKSSASGFSVYAPTKGKPELVKKIALLNEEDIVAICGRVREIKYKVPRGPKGRQMTERVFCFEVDDIFVVPEKIAYLKENDEESEESADTGKKKKVDAAPEKTQDADEEAEEEKEDDGDSKPEVEPVAKPEVKQEDKPAAKPAAKPEVKQEVKPAAKPEVKTEDPGKSAPAENETTEDEWS